MAHIALLLKIPTNAGHVSVYICRMAATSIIQIVASFFSVVASTEGIAIRIHRAERESTNESNQGFIIQEYPLRFEYKEFCNIPRNRFERTTVLETFEKILLGYGVKVLHPLLQTAAKDVVNHLSFPNLAS